MLSRRDVIKGAAAAGAGVSMFGGYAVAEPLWVTTTRYTIAPKSWPQGFKLRLAVIADLHVCEPWMGVSRVAEIVEMTNALGADAVLLLGDYVAGKSLSRVAGYVPADKWASVLGGLKAPLGVHAILGNHDWWDDQDAQKRRAGPTVAGLALEAAGIPVYENRALRLNKDGRPFWIAGVGDQWAFVNKKDPSLSKAERKKLPCYTGMHDLAGTLGAIDDDAPVVLMVHEPDIFPDVPDRVALTVAGHTHGGQLRVLGHAPFVPSKFGDRFAYGHIVEDGRDLVVSGGLGCSSVPLRFGSPPEIVVIELGADPANTVA